MDFSPLAPYYRLMEAALAGGALQRMRVFGMEALSETSRLLIVGDGPGRGTEALLRVVPGARITVVEMSARMVAIARRRLRQRGMPVDRVEWVCADVREWDAPGASFDVIVTQFVLDCFAPDGVAEVVGRLSRIARSRAVWLLSDFRIPPKGWRRQRARLIHELMYGFFRRTVGLEAKELTPPEPALARCGFILKQRKLASAGLIHADVWSRG